MDLEQALRQFEIADSNLVRLERTWEEMSKLLPGDISFLAGSPESAAYTSLRRDFEALVAAMPSLNGWNLELVAPEPDEIAQMRLDGREAGILELLLEADRAAARPAEQIADYRHRFDRLRRGLVRERASVVFSDIDAGLADLVSRIDRDLQSVADDPVWRRVKARLAEAERLVGSSVQRRGRWTDLRRHLNFALGVDLHDIHDDDWPSVRRDLESALYAEREPIPISVSDLGVVTAERPKGAVRSGLEWQRLDDSAFERLVFALIAESDGYENAQWLTQTNAPDRSRDLSADRVFRDPLAGTIRQRVIVQCKRWTSKSVAVSDLAAAVAAMKLWEPPTVDVLIVATTGRFTADAVQWIERHNLDVGRPRVEPWPESHLELLMSERPELVADFKLRET